MPPAGSWLLKKIKGVTGMVKKIKTISILLICLIICFLQIGNSKDLAIGEVEFPSLRWGEQKATLEVTNNGELSKFIVVEIEIQFIGEYLNPNRVAHTNFILSPGETAVLDPTISVPGNFGRSKIFLRVYDVVDTLDVISLGHLAYEQPFFITFNLPDAMVPYFQDKILYPPRVGDDYNFDTEFARLMPLLLSEGNTPGDIAEMAMCDTSFVEKIIGRFMDQGFARKNDKGNYQLNFPVILMEEADEGRKMAMNVADSLANIIGSNIDDYNNVLDSLKMMGRIPKDTNVFYDGGALLYFPYPIISCLGLWWDLAEDFIVPNTPPLSLYTNSNPCNINIPLYMYAVTGGDINSGTHYFSSKSTRSGIMMYFGDEVPKYKCVKDMSKKYKKVHYSTWSLPNEFEPKGFMIDTSIVRPAVDALVRDADPLIKDTYKKVTKLGLSYNHKKITRGYYFWFWNLVATHTTNILIEKGVIVRMGTGQFKFDSLPQKGKK